MYPVHDPQALRNPRSDAKEREVSRGAGSLFYSDSFAVNNGWLLGEGWNIGVTENYAVDVAVSSISKTFDIILVRCVLIRLDVQVVNSGHVGFAINGESVGDTMSEPGILDFSFTPSSPVISVGIVGNGFSGSVGNFELWLV